MLDYPSIFDLKAIYYFREGSLMLKLYNNYQIEIDGFET
tara:strand:- start:187 stop:303 length:117 start_codon:yes stop_codon:yes gene_type:complete